MQRVINYNNHQVLVAYFSDNERFEKTFDVDSFRRLFGINFSKWTSVTFEPDRNLFLIEEIPGKVDVYQDPSQTEILKSLDIKQDIIFNYLRARLLEDKTIAEAHNCAAKKIKLEDLPLEEAQRIKEEAAKSLLKQEHEDAKQFLKATSDIALWYLINNKPVPQKLKTLRDDARQKLQPDIFEAYSGYTVQELGVEEYFGEA